SRFITFEVPGSRFKVQGQTHPATGSLPEPTTDRPTTADRATGRLPLQLRGSSFLLLALSPLLRAPRSLLHAGGFLREGAQNFFRRDREIANPHTDGVRDCVGDGGSYRERAGFSHSFCSERPVIVRYLDDNGPDEFGHVFE